MATTLNRWQKLISAHALDRTNYIGPPTIQTGYIALGNIAALTLCVKTIAEKTGQNLG